MFVPHCCGTLPSQPNCLGSSVGRALVLLENILTTMGLSPSFSFFFRRKLFQDTSYIMHVYLSLESELYSIYCMYMYIVYTCMATGCHRKATLLVGKGPLYPRRKKLHIHWALVIESKHVNIVFFSLFSSISFLSSGATWSESTCFCTTSAQRCRLSITFHGCERSTTIITMV